MIAACGDHRVQMCGEVRELKLRGCPDRVEAPVKRRVGDVCGHKEVGRCGAITRSPEPLAKQVTSAMDGLATKQRAPNFRGSGYLPRRKETSMRMNVV